MKFKSQLGGRGASTPPLSVIFWATQSAMSGCQGGPWLQSQGPLPSLLQERPSGPQAKVVMTQRVERAVTDRKTASASSPTSELGFAESGEGRVAFTL